MRILSLDLAQRTGFADGEPGAPPQESGAIVLKKPGDPQEVAFRELDRFLRRRFLGPLKPDLVVREAPFNLAAYARYRNGQAQVEMAFGMRAIVLGLCSAFEIRCETADVRTVRKHILSRGVPDGTRDEVKLLVIKRCKLVGLMPKDAPDDDDRGDAIAQWCWACDVFGRKQPQELFLFGETLR
jgi:hypothetical protein